MSSCSCHYHNFTSPSLVIYEGQKVPLELIQKLLSLIECMRGECVVLTVLGSDLLFGRILSEINLLVQEQISHSRVQPVIIHNIDLCRVQQYQKRLKNALSPFTVNFVSFMDSHVVCELYS
jgi:hypothetical protein